MQSLLVLRRLSFALGLIVALLSSCTSIRLISEYDEITDKAATALQEKVSRFFVNVENDLAAGGTAKYDKYKDFYTDAKVDLRTLKVRADAIDKNTIVQNQVAELTNMVETMEQLHKLGFSSIEQVKALEQPFNSAFTAIVKLQLALKRGSK